LDQGSGFDHVSPLVQLSSWGLATASSQRDPVLEGGAAAACRSRCISRARRRRAARRSRWTAVLVFE